MRTIPIIFAIDKNVVIQCGVTITSLLKNANSDTFYDIFVLFNRENLNKNDRITLREAFLNNTQCQISFIDVGNAYKETESITSGHVTSATYYRLSIPKLFPQFEKVIYSDIDIIFQQDLSDLYYHSLQNKELIAAVLDLAINNEFFFHSDLPQKIGKSEKDYFNAGFLVMNLKQMREEGISNSFKELSKIKYDQNDQDVLNIVCNGRVQFLPSAYNFQLNHFSNYMWGRKQPLIRFDDLFRSATLHYTWKNKPWNSLECVASDTWWHYYKLSPFYSDQVYFKHQQKQIESIRNDYHNRTNKQLFIRILSNIKHKIFKQDVQKD